MSEQTPQPDIFFQIRNRTRATAAMLAGMKLDVFTPLKDGPLHAEQLASKLGVEAGKLSPLLYALVIAGLLNEEEGAFSNTPETDEFLVKGKAGYMGETHKIWYSNLQASLKTAETIQAGVPQAKYDWTNMAEDELKALGEVVRIWNLESGTELLTLTPDRGVLALTADGSYLYIGTGQFIGEYSLNLENTISLAEARVTRWFTEDECQRYLHMDTCPPAP